MMRMQLKIKSKRKNQVENQLNVVIEKKKKHRGKSMNECEQCNNWTIEMNLYF